MDHNRGFTVVEIIIAILFVAFAGTLFVIQKRDIEAANRDNTRKAAINAMYYNLEELYFPARGAYPRTIDASVLKAMDPDLFKDPSGVALGTQGSNYRYDGIDCEADACKSYSLRADLEKEADFVKTPRVRN